MVPWKSLYLWAICFDPYGNNINISRRIARCMKNSFIELVLRREKETSLKLYFSGVKVRLHQRLAKIIILRIVATVTAYKSPLHPMSSQFNYKRVVLYFYEWKAAVGHKWVPPMLFFLCCSLHIGISVIFFILWRIGGKDKICVLQELIL